MKKFLSVTLALAMAGTMLIGCGSEDASNNSEQNSSAADSSPAVSSEAPKASAEVNPDEKVTLRFSWWGGDERTAATLEVIEQFTELYPNVTIEAEYGGSDGYHDKLATNLAAGTAADIFQVDPETFPSYVDGGMEFYSYDEFGFDFSNFDEAYIGLSINGRYDGVQLGLPTGIAGPATLYNADLAKEIGIDFSTDYTWNDLLEWGKKVKEYDPEMYLLCCNKDYVTNLVVYPYLKQLTGTTIFNKEDKVLNLTEEQLKEAFDFVELLYKEEVVAPASYSAAYSGDALQSDPNWIGGKYVATFSYISTMDVMMAAAPDLNYAVGNLPILENALDNGHICNTPQLLVVPKSCEHPEVAYAFLDYFFNNEKSMETLACTRSVPPTAKAREICEQNGTLSTLSMEAANIASGLGGLTNDGIASSQEAKQIMSDAVEMVGYGSVTPADAAADTISLLGGLVE